MVWKLNGTESQNQIIADVLARCTFPFEVMAPALQNKKGVAEIPVEWDDLSRYAQILEQTKQSGGHGHIHEGDDTADPIEYRERVLGLAWYSGRVTMEQSLESDPELAGEVFLAEGAHMIDFFWMDDAHRTAIWNALHPDEQDIDRWTPVEDETDLGHGHGWFDVGGYYSWVGEAWMGLFVRAYSDLPVTIAFDHPPTDHAVAQVRGWLTPYFSVEDGEVHHDSHRGYAPAKYYVSPPGDLRPCGVCKP